jgi:putative addiction module component (TIGR02574 family)
LPLTIPSPAQTMRSIEGVRSSSRLFTSLCRITSCSRGLKASAAAMALPAGEREAVARELLASIGESDRSIDEAWAAEFTRRAERVLGGESRGVPWGNGEAGAAEVRLCADQRELLLAALPSWLVTPASHRPNHESSHREPCERHCSLAASHPARTAT